MSKNATKRAARVVLLIRDLAATQDLIVPWMLESKFPRADASRGLSSAVKQGILTRHFRIGHGGPKFYRVIRETGPPAEDYTISTLDKNVIIGCISELSGESVDILYQQALDIILTSDSDKTAKRVAANALKAASKMAADPIWKGAASQTLFMYQVVVQAIEAQTVCTRQISSKTWEPGDGYTFDTTPGERWLRTMLPGLPSEESA